MRRASLTREEIVHLLQGYTAGGARPADGVPDRCDPLAMLHQAHGIHGPSDLQWTCIESILPALQDRWERVAQALSDEFSARFQQPAAIGVQRHERTTSGRFLWGCSSPAVLVHQETEDAGPPVWLSIELPLLFALLERLLGGPLVPYRGPCRALTELEKRLAMRIVQPCWTALHAGWPGIPFGEPSPGAIRERIDPGLLRGQAPLAACTMALRTAGVRGTLSLAIPWETALPACLPEPAAHNRSQPTDDAEPASTVSVIVARATIPASELRDLEVGDLIATERRPDQPVQIAIDGRVRYLAQAGEMEGRKAVRLV